MNGKCDKCNKNLPKREYLTCILCQHSLDLTCGNVSSKLFYLMSPERKKTWKCQPCTSQQRNSSSTLTREAHDNITIRNKFRSNIPIQNSFDSLSEITLDSDVENTVQSPSLTTDRLNRSCPEICYNFDEKMDGLRDIISDLQAKLEAADNEIINLLSENCMYKEKLSKYEGKICVLKQICKLTPPNTTNSTGGKKRKGINRTRLDFSQREESNVETINVSSHKIRANETNDPRSIETNRRRGGNKKNKNNILILSSNTRNKLLPIIENQFGTDYNYCHHALANVGILGILDGIETKAHDLKETDYCVILIGETDFTTSKDYKEIILGLRRQLQKIQHTNVVICYPTYRYGWYTSVYNSRVECFIRLLERDVQASQYAYLMDSNRHLSYDMFMVKGCINRTGIKNVINNLGKTIKEINNYKFNDRTDILNIDKEHKIATDQTVVNVNVDNSCNQNASDNEFFRG